MEDDACHTVRMRNVFCRSNCKFHALQRFSAVMEQGFYKGCKLIYQSPAFQHLAILIYTDFSGHKGIFQNNLRCLRDSFLLYLSLFCHASRHVRKHKAYLRAVRLRENAVFCLHKCPGKVHQISFPRHVFRNGVLGIRLQSFDDKASVHPGNPGMHRSPFRIGHLQGGSRQLVSSQVVHQADSDRSNGILHVIAEGQIMDVVVILRLVYFKENLLSAAVVSGRSLRLHNPVHSHGHIRQEMRDAIFPGYSSFNLLSRRINHGPMQVLHILRRVQGKLRSCLRGPDAFIHAVLGNRHACGNRLYINDFIVAVCYRLLRQIVRRSVWKLRHRRIENRLCGSFCRYDVIKCRSILCILRDHIVKAKLRALSRLQASDPRQCPFKRAFGAAHENSFCQKLLFHSHLCQSAVSCIGYGNGIMGRLSRTVYLSVCFLDNADLGIPHQNDFFILILYRILRIRRFSCGNDQILYLSGFRVFLNPILIPQAGLSASRQHANAYGAVLIQDHTFRFRLRSRQPKAAAQGILYHYVFQVICVRVYHLDGIMGRVSRRVEPCVRDLLYKNLRAPHKDLFQVGILRLHIGGGIHDYGLSIFIRTRIGNHRRADYMDSVIYAAACFCIFRHHIFVIKGAGPAHCQIVDDPDLAARQAVVHPEILQIHVSSVRHYDVIDYRLPRIVDVLIRMLRNCHCRMIYDFHWLGSFGFFRRRLDFLLCVLILHLNCHNFFRPPGQVFRRRHCRCLDTYGLIPVIACRGLDFDNLVFSCGKAGQLHQPLLIGAEHPAYRSAVKFRLVSTYLFFRRNLPLHVCAVLFIKDFDLFL